MNIIELAKNAGLKVGTNISGVTLIGSPSNIGISHISVDELQCFADEVLEEAAIECDKRAHAGDAGALMAARAIRALKGAKE